MSVNFNDIRNFLKVSETLNVTRASELIGVSQPALSYSLKRLEKELRGQLILRLKNGVRLTKLGEEFKRRSRRLIYEWEEVRNITESASGHVKASYTLAIHPSIALYTLEHFLPKLQKELPGLNLNFLHGLSREMVSKVINWEADFSLAVNPIRHPDLVIVKLCEDEVSIFHARKTQNKLAFDSNLAQSQHILKKLKKIVNFDSLVDSGNLEVVAKLTALGLSYGILPSRVASGYPHLRKLKGAPSYKDEICLVYRPEKHNNAISRRIFEIIKAAPI